MGTNPERARLELTDKGFQTQSPKPLGHSLLLQQHRTKQQECVVFF